MAENAKAGPETWKKIAELISREILRRGSKGYGVSALQAALNAISKKVTECGRKQKIRTKRSCR